MKYLTLFILLGFGVSCAPQNALKLHHKRKYTETNNLKVDSNLKLEQHIFYNSGAVDGWKSYLLILEILDTEKFKNLKTIQLPQHKNIVDVSFNISSPWFWEEIKTKISGEIKLLNWTEKKIELKENLLVKVENSKGYSCLLYTSDAADE